MHTTFSNHFCAAAFILHLESTGRKYQISIKTQQVVFLFGESSRDVNWHHTFDCLVFKIF